MQFLLVKTEAEKPLSTSVCSMLSVTKFHAPFSRIVESFLVGFARFSSRKASSWLPKPCPYKIGQQLSTCSGSPAPVFNSDIPFYASSVNSPLLIHAAHMLSLFPTCLDDSFLGLEEVILEYQPALLKPSSLSDSIPWDSQSGPWRDQSLLSKKQDCRPALCTTPSF